MSFRHYIQQQGTPADAVDFVRNEYAHAVLSDLDRDTKPYEGPEFNYWKLLMSSEPRDGKNDFTDEQIRFLVDKAHRQEGRRPLRREQRGTSAHGRLRR